MAMREFGASGRRFSGNPTPPIYGASWRSPATGRVWVRVVWNGGTGEIMGVRVGNPDGQVYARVRGTEPEVRQAFAHVLAEDIVAAVWPVPGTGVGPSASSAELLTVAEELVDPRLLAARLAGVAVQVAAVHAGIPLPVARLMGQAVRDLFVSLLSPDPDSGKVQAVQFADLVLSAADGSLIDSPALQELGTSVTADAIDKLLEPPMPGRRGKSSTLPLRKPAVGSSGDKPDPATGSHPDLRPADLDLPPAHPHPTGIDDPGPSFGG